MSSVVESSKAGDLVVLEVGWEVVVTPKVCPRGLPAPVGFLQLLRDLETFAADSEADWVIVVADFEVGSGAVIVEATRVAEAELDTKVEGALVEEDDRGTEGLQTGSVVALHHLLMHLLAPVPIVEDLEVVGMVADPAARLLTVV